MTDRHFEQRQARALEQIATSLENIVELLASKTTPTMPDWADPNFTIENGAGEVVGYIPKGQFEEE